MIHDMSDLKGKGFFITPNQIVLLSDEEEKGDLSDRVEATFKKNGDVKKIFLNDRKLKIREQEGKNPFYLAENPKPGIAAKVAPGVVIGYTAAYFFLGSAGAAVAQPVKHENFNPNRDYAAEVYVNNGQSVKEAWKKLKNAATKPFKKKTTKKGQKGKYEIEPVDIDILGPDGRLHKHLEDLTAEQAKNTVIYVPYGGSLVFHEQRAGKFESDVMLLYDYNEDGKTEEKVVNFFNGRTVFDSRVDFIRLNLPEGARGFWTYQLESGLEIAASIKGIFEYGYEPRAPEQEIEKKIVVEHRHVWEEPPRQPEPAPRQAPCKPKEKPVEPSFSLKGLFVIGNETYTLEADPEQTFNGGFAEGVYYHPNIHAWASLLGLMKKPSEIDFGGRPLNRTFTQANLGIDYRVGPLMAEIEGIFSANKWGSSYARLMAFPLEESNYQGVFFGGGLAIPFGKGGFASKSFLTISGGYGFGKVEHKLTDPWVHGITFDSEGVRGPYLKAHLMLPFGELTYSTDRYDNELKTLDGKASNLSGKLFLPLNVLSKTLDGFYLVGLYGISERNDNILKDYKSNIAGFGLMYRK